MTTQAKGSSTEATGAIDDQDFEEVSDGEIMDGEEPADRIKMNKIQQMAQDAMLSKQKHE